MIPTDNLIAGRPSAENAQVFHSINPDTQEVLPGDFTIATIEEIDRAVDQAHMAWSNFRKSSGQERATLLRSIAEEIEALGSELIDRAIQESGLPQGRLEGERNRTCNQLRLFADLVEEGSWVAATIDEADAGHQPAVDLRKMQQSLGVVVVFPASNFPLAFSTAGGDTASALAAGCPVVVKAHPSHAGTNNLVSTAVQRAVERCGLPRGIFSSLQGAKTVGEALVKHPLVKAVGFTGSFTVGKHLMDLATRRPVPIPVYAEMGSNNPIFILSEKLASASSALAITIAGSVNLGAGQFCTNPGLIILEESAASQHFIEALRNAFADLKPATMLSEGIRKAFNNSQNACTQAKGVALIYQGKAAGAKWTGTPAFATVKADDFLAQPALQEEVFGPFTLLILCQNQAEVFATADALNGQLTATILGTEEELAQAGPLVNILSTKAGRVLFDGVPTGVAVSPAMHHGGPFPAGSSGAFTSVGTDAITRFTVPVCYQSAPQVLLPEALKDGNPLGIWRKVNGKLLRG